LIKVEKISMELYFVSYTRRFIATIIKEMKEIKE